MEIALLGVKHELIQAQQQEKEAEFTLGEFRPPV